MTIHLETLNQTLFLFLNANEDAPQFMLGFAMFMAEWPVGVAALLAGVAVYRQGEGRIPVIVQLLLTVLPAMLAAYAIRESWYHARPFVIDLGKTWVAHDPTPSFPSFHATFLFSLGFALLRTGISKITALFILILGTLTAWARVYLGVHFPFDMIGALVTAFVAMVTIGRVSAHKINHGE